MTSTRHILVDARPLVDPNAGGVGRVTRQVLESLVQSANDVTWTFATTGAAKPVLPETFTGRVIHVHIPLPNKIWSVLCMFGLKSLDREVTRRTSETYKAVLLPNLGFVGRLTAPYALILHDLSFLIEPRWFTPKMRLWHRAVGASGQIRRANRLFAVSETTACDAERLLKIPRDKIEVFHPGTKIREPGTLRLRSGQARNREPAPNSRYVLAFGESNPRKNASTAIAAVADLREDPQFTDLHLIFIGGNSKLEIRNSEWTIRKNIVSDVELAHLYQQAAALLYPSWYEGFGLPLHEAAQFGTPCLASAHGALPETVPEGTLLIPPTKPHLWASALRDVLTNPDLYRTSFDPTRQVTDTVGMRQWIQSLPQ
ncbi:hypothetical protein A3E39_03620 [Candidatus Uhrbacteria bacterium RIFCSPHIGHO2_12_FULL_60_25]|uniref:Glycosyl transferase family 1 domain-containing protein n=1 Tax=Candidatus Uhrbacteria bacterium RIFCSPHIGHO2_12_FULL_60_25 TaxID=1802399 RepID=A0A1F7UL66_9BACT|nr:MAG: hypothetical protein A3E39_03620 [Candidatus Uhrbacteria bacterium RIFCSPHIGHO2_12_FULL_60_25]